jgi:hypothetical protein
MRNRVINIAIICAMLMANISVAAPKGNNPVIAVIIAKTQNIDALKLSSDNLNLIYWRKQLFWPEGLRIKPVNLRSQHPLRLQFSQAVLGSSPNAQIDYWNGQYFNGILPPHSVNSEEAVIRYVAQTTGAIGYIDACKIDERVKPLFWIVNDRIATHPPKLPTCIESEPNS